jgi:hypothetical protein
MKVTYEEKTNSDFTPFSLILEFETDKDVKSFYAILDKTSDLTEEECGVFVQIHDVIRLKISK